MKDLKLVLLVMAVICFVASATNAATITSYTASDSPGSTPDGNGNTVDVWTVTGSDGPNRSYLQGWQDGTDNMWAIWDTGTGNGTYATHTFAGGALTIGQSVSIDYAHNTNINFGYHTGIKFLDGTNNEVEFGFLGGDLNYSKYDTGTGVYNLTGKLYDNYDIFQVVFTLTGSNSYTMTVTEGSISDAAYVPSGWKPSDDNNPDVGNVIDSWTGTFTGTSITGIQVYTEGGDTSDQWFDNLTIDAKPYNPFPAYQQLDVIVSGLELSWSIPPVPSQADPNVLVIDPNLVSFDLRYSDDADPNWAGITPISITTWDSDTFTAAYTPSPELNKNATYSWRVDSVRDNGILEGDVWLFDTELTKPIILTEPVYQIVDAGSTAIFTVEISSETPETYEWYKYVDGVSDTMLVDGGDVSGTATDTLSIANVEIADEGLYYCIVNNDAGIDVLSESAPLAVKRKIAYWPFDGGVLDSTVAGSPTSVVVGDPNLAPESILGDAIVFDDGVDMLYTDPNQTSYFDICDYAMTVGCWIKTTDDQDWSPLVCRNGENNQGWQLRQSGFTDDRPCFTTRGTGNDDGTPANRTIYDDQWHYVVATFDGTVKKVYIDGIVSKSYSADDGSLISSGDDVTGPMNPSESPVAIAGRVMGNLTEGLSIETWNIVAGIYDEVEIYNYALDATTIAQTYADMTVTDVCLGQTYDLDDDCMVNLNDLGLLASEWLNSQLVEPTP